MADRQSANSVLSTKKSIVEIPLLVVVHGRDSDVAALSSNVIFFFGSSPALIKVRRLRIYYLDGGFN